VSSVAGLFFLKYYIRLKLGSESSHEGGKNPIFVLFKEQIPAFI